MFATKGMQQKYVRRATVSGTVYRSYPILSFGIVARLDFRRLPGPVFEQRLVIELRLSRAVFSDNLS